MIKILTFIIFSRFSNNVDDVDFGISFEFWFQTFCSSHSVRYLERGGTKRKKKPYQFVWTHNMLCQGTLGANLDGKFNVVKLRRTCKSWGYVLGTLDNLPTNSMRDNSMRGVWNHHKPLTSYINNDFTLMQIHQTIALSCCLWKIGCKIWCFVYIRVL